jgi:hypothetical protein
MPPPSADIDVAWSQVSWNGRVNGVTYDSQLGMWLAFGREEMWTSTSGTTWRRHPFEGELIADCCPHPLPASMVNAVRMRGQLWAAGLFNNDEDGIGLLMWSSTDAATWTILPQGGYVGFSSHRIVSNGSRLAVAVAEYGSGQGKVMTSSSGLRWISYQPESPASMQDIYGDEDGFVAVGYRLSEASGLTPTIWTSPDGLTWTDVSPNSQRGELDAVARLTDGAFVAAGVDGDGSVMVWRSEDGISWSRAPFTAPPFAPHAYRRIGLASSGDTAILTADVGVGWRAWASPDGVAWGELRPTTAEPPNGVILAVRGNQVLVFAEAGTGGEDSDLWIGQFDPPGDGS